LAAGSGAAPLNSEVTMKRAPLIFPACLSLLISTPVLATPLKGEAQSLEYLSKPAPRGE
jgi:hypothetical protein